MPCERHTQWVYSALAKREGGEGGGEIVLQNAHNEEDLNYSFK